MRPDAKYMKRCLELAALGAGYVAPNPMVGCVVVHNGKIIGEGYHREYGQAHAEVNAIKSVRNPELLEESTLYVSLEPCAHFGKTPPCSDLIIEKKIPHVVIGTIDPFAQVAGKGIEKMQKAGIRVEVGLLQDECRHQNRRFFTFHQKKRPYIVLKWAQTLDGFLDLDRTQSEYGQPTWITNELSRRAVHKQRTQETAILIGSRTAEKDNPSLTVREWAGPQPIRLVIDRQNRLSNHSSVFDDRAETLVFGAPLINPPSAHHGYIPVPEQANPLAFIIEELYRRDIQSVIVEGGYQLLSIFIEARLWDEAHIYYGMQRFGNGVPAPNLTGVIYASEQLDNCLLQVWTPVQVQGKTKANDEHETNNDEKS